MVRAIPCKPHERMTSSTRSSETRRRGIRAWLMGVAALMLLTLVVGGATRLTESGLSIVEWRPVTGALPPLTEAAWQTEFEKYQAIPQYRERNLGMSLDAFKTIYWWEWSHRLLARVVGAAFLLPLLWFLWRGWIEPPLRTRLWIIFGAGALLGGVGWWMVSSGLADRVSVSQYRLAFHLTLACGIFAAILWTAQGLRLRAPGVTPTRLRVSAIALLMLVLLQIYLGALVAGLRAGLLYNTWPLIDGSLVPDAARLLFEQPLWRNFFENALMVQFVHRMVAYTIWLLALLHAADVLRRSDDALVRTGALVFAGAVTLQAALGIFTLIYQVPIALALAHQGMAMLVLTIAVIHAQRLSFKPAGVAAVARPAAQAT
jgi:cytochrome c oxidase assembly protein subunit 15